MKIIYFDSNDKQRQLYSVYLENTLDEIEVVEMFDIDKAMSYLEDEGYVDLVLASNSKGEDVGKIFRYINEYHPTTTFALMSTDLPEMLDGMENFDSSNSKHAHILFPLSPANFRERILNLLAPSRFAKVLVPAFKKVRMIHFYRFNKVLCSVYLKLSERKYVKVINENQEYSFKDLEKFRAKGLEYLFIRNDDFDKFHVTFTKAPFLKGKSAPLNREQLESAILGCHAIIRDTVLNLGFSEDVIDMAQKSVEEIANLAEDDNKLSELLFQMRSKMDYLYDHSYMVAIICCDILKEMKWATDEKVKSLCMASLFHDITIQDPDLAMVQGQNDEKLQKFSDAEIKEYMSHPFDASNILCSVDFVTTEAEDIIRQHHETVDGNGFPNRLNPSRLEVPVCIFIIAHSYVSKLYEYEFDETQEPKILEYLQENFNAYEFKSPLEAFLKKHQKTKKMAI